MRATESRLSVVFVFKTGSLSVALAGLELEILQWQPTKFWDCRYAPPLLAEKQIFICLCIYFGKLPKFPYVLEGVAF
jgi:hypothetical protein